MIQIRPISITHANEFVQRYHRHHGTKTGCRFAIACFDGDRLCGVAICSNPVARNADDGLTLEVSRLCTDGTRNACSKLYGACARIAKDMGFRKVQTYILESENGTSLKASGWKNEGVAGALNWNNSKRQIERNQNEQLTLFPGKHPPEEMKTRYAKHLIEGGSMKEFEMDSTQRWILNDKRITFGGECQNCMWFYYPDDAEPCSICSGTDEGNKDCYFNAQRLIGADHVMDTVKDKEGKPRMSLILPGACYALVRIREYGLKKYPDANNWKRVPKEDWLDALMRHLLKYISGEKIDPESGYPHLWHALANLSYMIEGDLDNVK